MDAAVADRARAGDAPEDRRSRPAEPRRSGRPAAPPTDDWPPAPEQARLLFSLSRRHELPFSVVVIRPVGTGGSPPGGDAVTAELRERVRSQMRGTDLLAGWSGAGGYVIFCPGTPREGAIALVRRLVDAARHLDVGIGTASFRDDGFMLESLVECAAQRERALRLDGRDDGDPPRGGVRPAEGAAPTPGPSPLERRLKRLFDLSIVVALSPLWLPLAVAVALAVKLSDPRAPILFVQQRTGFAGRRFAFYKFRTMVRDAEKRKAQLQHRNERAWPDFKIENDPRVTRLGRLLRATSLDELPQLWNVLRGEMSLVGPRPTSFAAETYRAWQTARLGAVPGLTGLWQVEARNASDFAERMRLDLRYIENQSFLYDLKILLRTVPALWNREGR